MAKKLYRVSILQYNNQGGLWPHVTRLYERRKVAYCGYGRGVARREYLDLKRSNAVGGPGGFDAVALIESEDADETLAQSQPGRSRNLKVVVESYFNQGGIPPTKEGLSAKVVYRGDDRYAALLAYRQSEADDDFRGPGGFDRMTVFVGAYGHFSKMTELRPCKPIAAE